MLRTVLLVSEWCELKRVQLQLFNLSNRYIHSGTFFPRLFPHLLMLLWNKEAHVETKQKYSFMAYVCHELLRVSCGVVTGNVPTHSQPKFKIKAEGCSLSLKQTCLVCLCCTLRDKVWQAKSAQWTQSNTGSHDNSMVS